MEQDEREEEKLLRSVALQNAKSILLARQRAEQELIRAKEALERKTAELAQSLSMMRATLECTTDGILVIGEDGTVTGFNEKYVEMWRVPREMMHSRDHRQLLEVMCRQFDDPRRFFDRIDQIHAPSPPESFDLLELADGRVFERFSKIQFVDRRNAGRVWSFRDITEHKRAEEALRDETRILDLLNKTGTALASNLDLRTLATAATDAATELSGAECGAFVYNRTGEKGAAAMLYAVSGAPAFGKLEDARAIRLFGETLKGDSPIRRDDVLSDPEYEHLQVYVGTPQRPLPIRSYLAVPVVSPSGDVIGGLFFGHHKIGIFSERTERIIIGVAGQAAVAIDNARLRRHRRPWPRSSRPWTSPGSKCWSSTMKSMHAIWSSACSQIATPRCLPPGPPAKRCCWLKENDRRCS